MSFVIGIDKGTSVIKAVVFDVSGRDCGSSQRRMEVLRPQPGWHEEDPERTWRLCVETIREAVAEAGISGSDIKGVGIAAHMGGAWVLDKGGQAVRNAVCWPDERAQDEQMALEQAGLLDRIFAISGNGLMPGITLMVLAWLSRHEPGVLDRANVVLCAKDYLRYRLTGGLATDPSDVSFVPGDIDRREHSAQLMSLCGAGDWVDRMPRILESGEVAGGISANAAAETGLNAGTPVVTGLGDASANALGVGRIRPGDALTVLGTSCLNSLILAKPDRDPLGLGFLFAMPCDRYIRILPNTSGTITMDWFLERFGGPKKPDGAWDFPAMEQLAGAVPRGAGGVLLLPYVNGSGVLAPFFDARARGSFFGVGSHTTRDHLLRAVYEALCFSTRDCFESMPVKPSSLTLTGGGSRSAFWAQMFADICGLPIEVSSAKESGALGVALLAGVATGLWPNLETAIDQTVQTVARFEPDPQAQPEYEGWFSLFREARDVYRGYSGRRADLTSGALTA
jgi:sugar (pentulose or hexulose) kinase